MFYWIYDYPSLNMGLLFAYVFAIATLLTIFFFRYFSFHSWFHKEIRANNMLHFVFTSFFALYGLLLGLLSVAAYQNYSTTGDMVTKEASSLGALYRDIRGYPEPMRSILQSELRDYTQYVIYQFWPLQKKGIATGEGTHRINQFIDEMMSFKPLDEQQKIIHTEAFRQANYFIEIRNIHLANISSGIPSVLWWVVAIGALVSILIIAILDMEIHVHIILSSIFSIFLSIVIFVIVALDNPFRGEVSIGPDAFQSIYDHVMKPNDELSKAMATLIRNTQNLGNPNKQGNYLVAGKHVKGLYFGKTLMNNNFSVVDQVVKQYGGTATLFVKDGDEFVRVTTTVRKDNSARAIGTILDPNGVVITAISNGMNYSGEATILGKPYITIYEPIRNEKGNIIGIYYVGFKK